jgi:ubiquinone biosynthesis protein
VSILNLSTIQRTYRHAKRYQQILSVLAKYGFEEFVHALHIERYVDIAIRSVTPAGEETRSLSRAERLRCVFEELGPTFVKIGQILSTRADLLPMDFIDELAKLQDNVQPVPFAEIRAIIEEDLGKPLAEAYREFDEQPLAAASIGQVHRARLRDGERVVVKVRRPSVEGTLAVDLEILLHLSGLAERNLPGLALQRPSEVVQELKDTLEEEIDYTREAAHTEHFAHNFSANGTVHVPRLYRSHSSERILTQEWIDGIKVHDIERLRSEGYDCGLIAHHGAVVILEMIFVHGFFHADPHPGNIFILPGNVLCLIDFGMVGRIDRQGRESLIDLLTGVVLRDEASTTDALLRLTFWDDEPNRRELESDVSSFIEVHCTGPLKNIDLGKLLKELMDVAGKHRLRIPPDLFLVIKALSTLEGIGRKLNPEFDVIGEAAPVIRRIQHERMDPGRIARNILYSARDFGTLVKSLPRELRSLMHQLRQGKLKMEFEHMGLESLEHTMDRITNRLAFAIVLAALIIGSSLIILSDIPPKWNDIPLIGLIGYLMAGLMGFRLLISISRSGKL